MKNWKTMTDAQLKKHYKSLVDSKTLFNPKTGNLKRAAIPLGLVREMNKRKLSIA